MQPHLSSKREILDSSKETWLWRSLPENSILSYNNTTTTMMQSNNSPCGTVSRTCEGWSDTNQYYCTGNCCNNRQIKSTRTEMKRFRVQTVNYELSQDLLEKQVEMLERKYGGAKARRAALIIQRAFRRYKLLNKFAAITAMAKAEKRQSRRFQIDGQDWSPSPSHSSQQQQSSSRYPTVDIDPLNFDPELVIRNNFAALYRELTRERPIRSLSMRERRSTSVDISANISIEGDIQSTPVQQHSVCAAPLALHQHQQQQQQVLITENIDTSSYSPFDEYYVYCNAPCSHVEGGKFLSESQTNKKIPPEVPKRTTSVLSTSRTSTSSSQCHSRGNSITNGDLSSSDSNTSLSTDSQRKQQAVSPEHRATTKEVINKAEQVSQYSTSTPLRMPEPQPVLYKVSETVRKRQYRVGLNLFNKKPERGISHLIRKGFLENSPQGVARFLITRKGLSKQMIGDYLGNLQNPFNMAVLECFAQELDLSGMQIDVGLRKFQTYFRMPGEAQKIERLMEIFGQRYCFCNAQIVAQFACPDTVFVLAFAIIMLNTDLHTPNLKPERRMKLEDFIKNLRGIDDGNDIDRDLLTGIYERVKCSEFKPGSDHVTQVMKVQSTIGGKKPNLAQPHRRLVCYCRLYEIADMYKKERAGVHQREVFLFNDLLVITKIFSKKKSAVTYTFRQSFSLCGITVTTFENQYYSYGIKLSQRMDGKTLIMLNARNGHDRCKFAEDLRESICEMDEMENIRIETELERQKSGRRRTGAVGGTENRDSGVADVELLTLSSPTTTTSTTAPAPVISAKPSSIIEKQPLQSVENHPNEGHLKRSALSNSLLDIHEQCEKPQRRGSVGSLDSGMSISFQSTSASTVSRDSSPQNIHQPIQKQQQQQQQQQSFLGGLFGKKDRKRSEEIPQKGLCRTTEV